MTQPYLLPNRSIELDVVETVPARDIVSAWKSDFGIDVAHLFQGVDEVRILQEPTTGQLLFDPPIEGDAPFYQALRRFKWYHPITKAEFSAAARWHTPSEDVLDIGAGDGGFAAHVGWVLYRGLETDPMAAQGARERGLDVYTMDMRTYRESNIFKPAHLVTAFQVLEHVVDANRFMQDMVSMTRPGGHIAIGVPDAGSYVKDLPDFMLNAPPHHLSWWTEHALGDLMHRHGLKIRAVERFSVEPWERQLWWMAAVSKRLRPNQNGVHFGQCLKTNKVVSYIASLALQLIPPPKSAPGSTLLMVAERT